MDGIDSSLLEVLLTGAENDRHFVKYNLCPSWARQPLGNVLTIAGSSYCIGTSVV